MCSLLMGLATESSGATIFGGRIEVLAWIPMFNAAGIDVLDDERPRGEDGG